MRLRDATLQVETLTKRMRQIFYRLRPPPLHSTPLPEALRDYCASFSQATRLRIDFHADEALPTVEGSPATALYRLLQECLNNVVKHAGATSVWVNVGCDDGSMSLSVEDDGAGFDARAVPDGIGLNGMRERFAMLDGDVRVESERGRGTRVSGCVPVDPEQRLGASR
jgi:two-component system sensor histidine kinase DegS